MLLWSMVERLPYWAVSRQTGVCGGRYTTRIVGDTTDIANFTTDLKPRTRSAVPGIIPAERARHGARGSGRPD